MAVSNIQGIFFLQHKLSVLICVSIKLKLIKLTHPWFEDIMLEMSYTTMSKHLSPYFFSLANLHPSFFIY